MLNFNNENAEDELNNTDKLKTPLPTSTCSKRLNYVKSSLNFSKSADGIRKGHIPSDVSLIINIILYMKLINKFSHHGNGIK